VCGLSYATTRWGEKKKEGGGKKKMWNGWRSGAASMVASKIT
jgi:hypothetical protein